MNPLGREEQTPFIICPEINKFQSRVSKKCIKLHRCDRKGKRCSHSVTAVNTLVNSALTLQELIQPATKLHLTPTQQPSCRVDLNTTEKKTQNVGKYKTCLLFTYHYNTRSDTRYYILHSFSQPLKMGDHKFPKNLEATSEF